jgi:hypothetical protein
VLHRMSPLIVVGIGIAVLALLGSLVVGALRGPRSRLVMILWMASAVIFGWVVAAAVAPRWPAWLFTPVSLGFGWLGYSTWLRYERDNYGRPGQ